MSGVRTLMSTNRCPTGLFWSVRGGEGGGKRDDDFPFFYAFTPYAFRAGEGMIVVGFSTCYQIYLLLKLLYTLSSYRGSSSGDSGTIGR